MRSEEYLAVPQGTFVLKRWPHRENETLRAWDAADEYLLQHIAEEGLPPSSTLVANDGFGALSVALAATHGVQMWSDSYLTHRGVRDNLAANDSRGDGVRFLTCLEPPSAPVDLLLLKVPKTLSLLEDQLYRLRPHLRADTVIVGAGMTRDIHTSTLELFEGILGPTSTSRARKKARLIFTRVDMTRTPGDSPYPTTYELAEHRLQLVNHAGVFSPSRIDPGTQLLLESLPRTSQAREITDLGCGNGVLGLVVARRYPDAVITFADTSARAIASARANMEALFGATRQARFRWTDCLQGIERRSAELIVCNPPFHQQRATDEATSWQMFREAQQVLEPEGELWVVGNRHLAYHTKLRRLFGNGEVVASDPTFVVLRAIKRG